MKTIEEIQAALRALPQPHLVEYRNHGDTVWRRYNLEISDRLNFDTRDYRTPQPPKKRFIRVEELPKPCFLHKPNNTIYMVICFDAEHQELTCANFMAQLTSLVDLDWHWSADGKNQQSFEITEP